jgi:predicted permease
VHTLVSDLKYAVRGLTRERGFAFGSILALSLGVGAITTLFAVFWGTLARPLPYRDPARLVTILEGEQSNSPIAPANYLDFRASSRSFSAVAAAQAWGANLVADGRAERVRALEVSGNLFGVLGVPAALGRTLTDDDDSPGRVPVVVISDGLWRRRFGGDPAVVGRRVALNGDSYAVVGVMPPGFRFAPFWQTQAELWVPLILDARRTDRGGSSLRLFARLRDGVSLDEARAEIAVITRRLVQAYPDVNAGMTTGVTPLSQKAASGVRTIVLAMLGLASLVLLVACANASTLALARTLARGRELAVRAALGASRGRLLRMVIAEGLVVGLAGAALGSAMAVNALRGLHVVLPSDSLPPHADISASSAVLLFAGISAVAAGVLASVVGAWQVTSYSLADATRDGGRGVVSSARGSRTRATVVAMEVALSIALATAAGLLGRTLLNLRQIDPGFRSEGTVALTVSLDGTSRTTALDRAQFVDEVLNLVRTRPGITAAGAINHLPLAGDLWTLGYEVEGRPPARPEDRLGAAYRVSTPGYLSAMGSRLVAGRDFTGADSASSVPVGIVNETLARRHWPHRGAVGRRLIFPGTDERRDPITIVGVVADTHQSALTTAAEDEIYLPLAQRPSASARAGMTLVAHTTGATSDALSALRNAVWSIDRSAAIYEPLTLDEVLDREVWRERLAANLAVAFAALALVLAALGIHGVVGYAVSRRTREFGIRLALGAAPTTIGRLAMREALGPVGAGVATGLALAYATGRLLSTMLVGLSPHDPTVLSGTLAALVAVSLVAAWRPAYRASRLDPAITLRDE